jgi:hypothetical protein
MFVVSVQLCTSVPPTRSVIDSELVVPLARTVMLSPPPLLELEEELLELDELLELLELEELLLEEELELDDELLEPPPPEQSGNTKLPLCVPWNPKLALCPADRFPFHEPLAAVTVLPDVVRSAFQELVIPGLWLKSSVTCQPLIAESPSLVTVTFRT